MAAASHTLTLRSAPHEARYFPSGLQAMPQTASEWSLQVAISLPVAVSQVLISLSELAVATRVPSGLNATALTQSVSSPNARNSLPAATSQMRTSPLAPEAPPAAASSLPSL